MAFMYMYKYCITLPKGVNEVKLSSTDRKTFVLAATTSASHTDDLVAFTPLTTEIDYEELNGYSEDNRLMPKTVTASHQNGTNEAGKYANDKNPTTKWCATSSQSKTPYLQYAYSEPVRVDRWMVLCAASESGGYVAEAFKLQYQAEDGSWVDFADVTSNQMNKVVRSMEEPVTATRFRLQMVHGEQGDGYTTRIYEFALYGQTESEYETGVEEIQNSKFKIQNGDVYDLAGRKVQGARSKGQEDSSMFNGLKKGVYIVNGKKRILP
jgi:alpha-mannosidase